MIPLISPTITFKDILSSYANKNSTNDKEKIFAAFFNKKYCYFLPEGRDAIFLSLKNIGLKKTDEIIAPSYICDIVPKVASLFCKVVYADVSKKTLVMDYDEIKKKITNDTRAVIVAHLYGNVSNLKKIRNLCSSKNIILIEDCAQSICSFEKGIRAGSLGDYSIFSFRFSKDINLLKGGALVTDKEINIAAKQSSPLKSFISILMVYTILKAQKIFYGRFYYYFKTKILIPFFTKTHFIENKEIKSLSSFEKELIIRTMNNMPLIVKKRDRNAKSYVRHLNKLYKAKKIALCSYSSSSLLRFNILAHNQKELIKFLLKNGIEAEDTLQYSLGEGCKNSEEIVKQVVNLPVHHNVKEKDIQKICYFINEFFKANNK